MNKIKGRQVPSSKPFPYQPLADSGLLTQFAELTRYHYEVEDGALFICNGWANLLSLPCDIYRELVVEFFSSVNFDDESEDYSDDGALTFMLGGVYRTCSVTELALRLGIYTQEDIEHELFQDFLTFTSRGHPLGYSGEATWDGISPHRYAPSRTTEGLIASPVIRFLHRVITTCLCPTGGAEKLIIKHLYFIETVLNVELHLNIPYTIACFLGDSSRWLKGNAPLYGGHYITKLARSYGVLEPTILPTLTVIPTKGYDERDLINMGYITKTGQQRGVPEDGPIVQPEPEAAAAAAPRRHTRRRVEQQQQGPEEEINLDMLSRQIGRVNLRLDIHDQQHEWMRLSQERMLTDRMLEPPYAWPVYSGPGPIGPYEHWPYGGSHGGGPGGDGAGPSGHAGGSGSGQ